MGFENGILMVTDSAQKLSCDGEVFWGQWPPLSEGSHTSRPLKGKRSNRDLGLRSHPARRHSAVPRQPDSQGFTLFTPWKKQMYVARILSLRSFCMETD